MKFLIFALVLAGAFCAITEDDFQEFYTNGYDKQGSIRVVQGTAFSIALRSNPSIGASWTLTNFDSLTNVEVSDSNNRGVYVSPDSNGMVGVAGKQKFSFQANTEGTEKLKFMYKRPWEKKASYLYELDVKIAPEETPADP